MEIELHEIAKLRPLEPLPPLNELEHVRQAVLSGMTNCASPGRGPDSTSRRPFMLKLVAGACCLAAAIAALALLLPRGRGGVSVGSANADPATVLHNAAKRMSTLPDVVPKPGQFYYIHDGPYRAWLSMDGAHDGLVISDGDRIPVPGCRNGRQVEHGNAGVKSVPCVPRPAYVSDAPTTKSAMVSYLGSLNSAGKEIYELLAMTYLRPPARAALFDALTELPGIERVSSGTAGLSDTEIGIRWPAPEGGSTMLVFDARSDTYIGVTTVGTYGEVGRSRPTYAIVNKVGAKP